MTRRTLSAALTVAGLALVGIALLHYARGERAQREGSEALRKQFASGYTPVAMAGHQRDDLPRGSVLSVAAGYPFGQPIARIRIPIAKMDWVVFGGTEDGYAAAISLSPEPGFTPSTAQGSIPAFWQPIR